MKLIVSPNLFVPPEISGYLGQIPEVSAQIKVQPGDFRVEEITCLGKQTTVSAESDFDDSDDLYLLPGNGEYVAVTLVKRCLTTFDAVYRWARHFGISARDVSYGGLKDRWAETSQWIVFRGVPLATVLKSCSGPEKLNGAESFIKDAMVVAEPLRKGKLQGNRFTLRVRFPGMSAKVIENYILPLLKQLEKKLNRFPNAYGRQRLGRRQNLLKVAYILITQGAAAAIKLFLTETSPNESPFVAQLRNKLLVQWEQAEVEAKAKKTTIDKLWWYFQVMREILEPHYENLNLAIEYKIIEQVLTLRDFAQVMSTLRDEFSLWIGAYQAHFFNQMLARVLRGETTLEDNEMPLFVLEANTIDFYKDHGMPEAIPEKVDPTVARLFLRSKFWKRKGKKKKWPLPREAFIEVQNLTSSFEDGCWNVSFVLRSGAYATTLLAFIVNMEGHDQQMIGSD